MTYAPDVFGGTRREVESLAATAEFQRFQVEAAYLTLTSNVVTAAVQEASVRGFNNFAQAKPLRLVLKITDTSRIGKFVYDLGGCATVTGLSKKTNQIIAAS